MTTQPFHLDPDVEHILQEVAKDPRSSLLRVERPKIIRGLTEREPSVGVATAGLTTAERHLVQTRRAETAYALRALCLQAILSDPRGKFLFSRLGTPDERQLSSQLETLRRSFGSASAALPSDASEGAAMVQSALHAREHEQLPVLRMCAAAHLLEPTDISRIHSAQWLLLGGQLRSSIALLLNALSFPNTPRLHAASATNLGLAYYKLGDLIRSMASYQRGITASKQCVPAVVGRFLVAIQANDRAEALLAAKMLDDVSRPSEEELIWQCTAEGSRRLTFHERLDAGSTALLNELANTTGPISRTLLYAIL